MDPVDLDRLLRAEGDWIPKRATISKYGKFFDIYECENSLVKLAIPKVSSIKPNQQGSREQNTNVKREERQCYVFIGRASRNLLEEMLKNPRQDPFVNGYNTLEGVSLNLYKKSAKVPSSKTTKNPQSSQRIKAVIKRGPIRDVDPVYEEMNGKSHKHSAINRQLIIVDEAAYTSQKLWLETIIPLLTMKDTVIICISTPSKDKHNFFHHMMTVTHPGTDRKVFGTIEFDLYCDECRKRKRPSCRHRQDLQPKWKGNKKFEIAEVLYGEMYQSYHLRETLGVITTQENQMFSKSWIDFLEKRPLWTRESRDVRPEHIYISIDPNASGSSLMAIILGLDGYSCHNSDETEEMLRNHLEGLRSREFLKGAWIISIYEKNTGYESGHHSKIINEYQPAYCIYDKIVPANQTMGSVHRDPGVVLNNVVKNKYGKCLSNALRYHKLFLYHDLVVGNIHLPNYDNRIPFMRKMLCKQFQQCKFKFTDIDPDNVTLQSSRTLVWNGKMNDIGKIIPGQNDDLIIAAGQGLYYGELIETGELEGFPYDKIFPNGPPRHPGVSIL